MWWRGGLHASQKWVALSLVLGLGACGDDIPSVALSEASPLPQGDDGTAADGSLATAGSSESSAEPIPWVPESIRWVAFGDTGEGNEEQLAVAAAAETVCAERGCDFAMLLGDNFYDIGVTSTDDPQFVDKFEDVYVGLDMPFYVVLGNHDYGVLSSEWGLGEHQVAYSAVNDKWVMPDFWYSFTSESGATQFFAMDTPRVMFNYELDAQRDWLTQELGASRSRWKIGMAHHPYISNGEHGNAGSYEGIAAFPLISGQYIKSFVEDLVCGEMQVYFSGHDHNRQSFDPVCGTYFFVSGASAKTTGFENRDDNPLAWGDDEKPGFAWAEIVDDTFTAAFYDLNGVLDYEMSFSL